MAKPAKKATSRRFGKGSTARANKNALTSKKGLKVLGSAVDRVRSEQLAKEQRRKESAAKRTPPPPPGVDTKRSRLEDQRRRERERFKTGNVRLVPRGSGGMRGGAGGGGILSSKIR